MTTIQCHLDHGSRSMRAGMAVSMVRNRVSLVAAEASTMILPTRNFSLDVARGPAGPPGRRVSWLQRFATQGSRGLKRSGQHAILVRHTPSMSTEIQGSIT